MSYVRNTKGRLPPSVDLIGFFTLAYAWSWACWLPAIAEMRSSPSLNAVPGWVLPLVLLGGYGPTISAISITAASRGRAGVKDLFSTLFRWRAPVHVHAVIWLAPPIFVGVGMLLLPSPSRIGDISWMGAWAVPSTLIAALAFGPLGEELGWRGYALPLIQRQRSALSSSLVIGVCWCFWHTPLFWAPVGTLVSGQPVTTLNVAKFLLFACGLSILFTWIVNKSNGSVLLAIAFHAVCNGNLTFLLFPDREPTTDRVILWWSMIPMFIFASALLCGDRDLSRPRQAGGSSEDDVV